MSTKRAAETAGVSAREFSERSAATSAISLRADMRDMAQNWDSELAALADEIAAIDANYRSVKEIAEAMVERQSASLQ